LSTRAAAIAGYFYDADASRLQQVVHELLAGQVAEPGPRPEALIVPHAGFVYSGPTAACAYRRLQDDPHGIRRVLLIGPAHRVYVDGMAIPSVDRFATPLGEVPLDRRALDGLASLPGVRVSDEAHAQEHCLEVQLPFLQTVLGDFSLVPVLVGKAAPERVAAVIDALAGDPSTLVVISSDMSHFLDYNSAQRIDAESCAQILDKSTSLSGEQACGAAAINGLMASDWASGLQVKLLQACNSGDTAGQRFRVVGYAAFELH
jgi:hypothetical protein